MRRRYVTRTEMASALDELREDFDERISLMATQADVDALTTAVDQIAADLTTAKTSLQSEIDGLAAANPTLDLTGLQAAVAPVDQAVQALGQLKPTPPAA